MKKRGEGELVFIFRLIVLFTSLAFLVFFVTSSNKALVNTEDMIFYPISQRILLSPTCFAYEDPALGRTVSGVIDYSKFKQERMDSCISGEEPKVSVRVRLKTDMDEHGPSEFVVYYNKEAYDEYSAIDLISPDVETKEKRFPVKLRRGSTVTEGVLSISVAWHTG